MRRGRGRLWGIRRCELQGAVRDRLCESLSKRGARLQATQIARTPEVALRSADELRDLTRQLSTGLAKLAPSGDADAKQIVDLSKRVATEALRQKVIAKRMFAAIGRGDAAALRRAERDYDGVTAQSMRLADPLDRYMRSYGFKNCGRMA